MQSKRSFPGWLGPVVGAIAGAGMGLATIAQNRNEGFREDEALGVILFTVCGLVGGLIVWWLDARRKKKQ